VAAADDELSGSSYGSDQKADKRGRRRQDRPVMTCELDEGSKDALPALANNMAQGVVEAAK
jgi:hypothetical protein